MGSYVSHFNVSLILWAKSQDSVRKPRIFKRRQRRAEADRTKVLLLTSQAPYCRPHRLTRSSATTSAFLRVGEEEVRAKIQRAIGPHQDLLTIVKRRKLQWYGHASRSSGLAKTILQGTVKAGRRQGGQRKRWEDNIREWTGLEFGKSQRAVETREKWRKLVAESSVVPQRPSRLRE